MQINKSRLMKRAWNIYRGNNPYSGNFSIALRRAWYVEKETIEYELKKIAEAEEKARMAERIKTQSDVNLDNEPSFCAGLLKYYGNSNRYYGD